MNIGSRTIDINVNNLPTSSMSDNTKTQPELPEDRKSSEIGAFKINGMTNVGRNDGDSKIDDMLKSEDRTSAEAFKTNFVRLSGPSFCNISKENLHVSGNFVTLPINALIGHRPEVSRTELRQNETVESETETDDDDAINVNQTENMHIKNSK